MKKNVASQVIGAQLVSATDGSAFTGAVLCYVTGDGGAQGVGSVGSPAGNCFHKGNGYHEYFPSQAETNYDHVSYTFVGTGAVNATKEVFTSFPQTGDSFARLGAPAGASIAADLVTIDDFVDTEVAAILAAVDTEVAAIKAKTDNLPAAPAAVGDIPTAIQNADALLDRNMATGTDSGSTTVRTARQALRALRNKWDISGTTYTVRKEDDSTASWSSTLTAAAGADPISASDPAGP